MFWMPEWKPKGRQAEKTKAQLYEMLAQAVRNTSQPPRPKLPRKVKREIAGNRVGDKTK